MDYEDKGTTINCSTEVKEVVKMVATFIGTSQRNVLRCLLAEQGLIPGDDVLNVFSSWTSETKSKFRDFMAKERKYRTEIDDDY
jgi:hypothetical protein